MSEKMKTLEDLFKEQIKDLYSAEKQIIEALPKMEKAASNEDLKKAFRDHLKETKHQKERLEKIGKSCGFDVDGETCKAAQGLIKEGDEMIKMEAQSDVKDAGLIACAQRIEHYEMSGYGTARQFAEQLGHSEAEKLLAETLEEERNADSTLNDIATGDVNKMAQKGDVKGTKSKDKAAAKAPASNKSSAGKSSSAKEKNGKETQKKAVRS